MEYLPDIVCKIEDLSRDLDLRFEKEVASSLDGRTRFYTSSCVSCAGARETKFFFIKVRIDRSPASLAALKLELENLTRIGKLWRLSEIKLPKIARADLSGPPEYILFDKIPGEPLGYLYEGHDNLLHPKSAQAAVLFLDHLLSFNPEAAFSREELGRRDQKGILWYKQKVSEFEPVLQKVLPASSIVRTKDSIEENLPILSDECRRLLHGDFSFANLIWGKDLGVVDWESMGVGSRAHDLAHLFVQAWQFPSWRGSLLKYGRKSLSRGNEPKWLSLFALAGLLEVCNDMVWWYHEHYVKKTVLYRFHTHESLRAHQEDVHFFLKILER